MNPKNFHRQIIITWLTRVCLVSMLFVVPAQATEVAARVQFVVGNVFAVAEGGDARRLRRGDRVFSGDTLESGSRSAAQLLFSDNSRMSVRANTILRLEDYHYDANRKQESKSIVALLQGAVRSITGLIGKFNKRNVILVTPVATIGVRGTDHETVHITRDFNGAESATLAGTYNKVYSGATTLKSAKGLLLLDSSQVGYVAGAAGNAEQPVLIDALPDVIEELLVKNLPLQENLDWARKLDGDRILDDSLATELTVLSLAGDTTGSLASRLDATTATVLKTVRSNASGDLEGALDGPRQTLPGILLTASDGAAALSSGGITMSSSGLGGAASLPLSGSSLESITTTIDVENLTLPSL